MDEIPQYSGLRIRTKFFLVSIILLVGIIVGYGIIYWWIYYDMSSIMNASVLKGQIISNEKAKEVKQQLRNMGFSFTDGDFQALNTPSSTNYKSSVLNNFEPQEDVQSKEEGYLVRDKTGAAYYIKVENNVIIPVPLISE